MGKSIDGVIIATADHTHAIITADAMTMGKHVYCQKPLTHSVYESRLLTKLAASTGVVTQMGNQGASDEGTDLVCEWIWNGEIGEVTKVECATDRPIWPQGLNVPEKADRIPNTLNWDLFTGPAKLNPYNQRLSSLELARMVGLRYRCTGRYGLSYSASAVQSLEAGVSYQGGRFFYFITECLRSSGPTREDDFPRLATICRKLPCRKLRYTGMTAV